MFHGVIDGTVYILSIVKWIKDFPHQARGKLQSLLEFAVITVLSAARTRRCRHRGRMGRGIALTGFPAD